VCHTQVVLVVLVVNVAIAKIAGQGSWLPKGPEIHTLVCGYEHSTKIPLGILFQEFVHSVLQAASKLQVE